MGRTDAELVEASRRGDAAAFGEIVARYQRAVAATAYAGTRDRALGEDVTQDAFVTAWRRLGALDEPNKLPAWLCGIARNLARKAAAKRRDVALADDVVGGTTPFDALGDREVDAIVAAALARVPEAYREPLVLFYCEQQSVRAVADAMGISVAAAEQRLSRGRKQLRSEVEPLVERAAAPRKELAAMVAAIVLGIGASQVEAATTTTKGSSMLKLGIAAMVAAAVAGGGYAVTRSTSTSQAAPTAPQPVEHAAIAPDPVSIHHAPARPSLAGAAPLACDDVVDHLADLVMESQPDAAKLTPEQLRKAVEPVIAHMRGACVSMSFSQEYLACLAASQSMFDVAMGCAKFQPAGMLGSHARPSKDIKTVFESPASIPAYTGPDHSCTNVANHLVLFSTPDPASLHKLPDGERAKVTEAIGRMHKTMPDQIEASCTQQEWPEAKRVCLLAATTHEAAQNCI